MSVRIEKVKSRSQRRTFIYLPEKIHNGRENWLPPIYMDERAYFNPRKNKSFQYCDTTLALAYKDDKPVGRIMGIINHRHNEYQQVNEARFGYLETYEDPEIVHALIQYVTNWAQEHGTSKLVGPLGFTDQDPEGFLIEGFEYPATIATYYNYKWMIDFVQQEGFSKEIDYVVYLVPIPDEIPDFYKKIYDRISRNTEFQLLEFTKRRQLKPYVRSILSLMNECFSELYGYSPLDHDEMEELARKYLPILDPNFVKAVERKDELVSFIVGIPDLSDGIRAARGRLFPFGIFKILSASKKTKQLDLLLGGVKEEYRGRGLDVLMGYATLKSAKQAGFEVIDTHHELEDNTKVRAEMERMNGEVYKRYRIFSKDI